jgi:AraC-like DNA-binding protein
MGFRACARWLGAFGGAVRCLRDLVACYNGGEVAVVYIERIPAPPLDQCVRILWYARVPHAAHSRERILPTGSAQIIMNLARDYLLDCPEGRPEQRMAASSIVGARSVYEIVDTSDMADLIGIVVAPGKLSRLVADAADLFSNRGVALEAVWGSKANLLRERLLELATPQERLLCLEGFLAERLARPRRQDGSLRESAVRFALVEFARAPLARRVGEVARNVGWSERRFSQVFREDVGLTPKVWCRIQRFQRAVRQLHAGGEVRWAELALDCGFYDQSHFANEFRAFSGIDATTYSARRTIWANHIAAS